MIEVNKRMFQISVLEDVTVFYCIFLTYMYKAVYLNKEFINLLHCTGELSMHITVWI